MLQGIKARRGGAVEGLFCLELKICGHGTVLALYRCAQDAFSTNVSELLRRKNK